MSITVAMRTQVSQLYVSLFGRAPDGEGLGYWVGQLAAGKTVAQVAQDMFNVTAARAYYPSFMTNGEIVAAFYVNVLGRTADAEGQAYWVGEMNKAGATKGSVIADMINAVVNYSGTDAAGVKSKALFANKVEVAQYYGEKNGTVAGATAALAGVTEVAATVTTAKAAVDAGANPGQTFMLTKGINEFTGTSGNDTFDATEDSTATATFSNLDKLDGGAGTDTLKIVQAAAVDTTAVVGATVTNIENINITSGAGVTANSTAWTGATALTITSGDDVTATAAATTDVTVAASALSAAAGNELTVNGGKSVTTTSADTLALGAGTTSSDIAIGGTTAAAGAVKV
ncbi:MAG: DUF4214 domain-containing protein, partial [Burkholderiaceae bacterium]